MAKIKRTLGNIIPDGMILNPKLSNWCKRAEDRVNRSFRNPRINFSLKFEGHDISDRDYPRQETIKGIIINSGVDELTEWLNNNPCPEEILVKECDDQIDTIYYGLFSDGGNCLSTSSSRYTNSIKWYWTRSEDETKSEFRNRLKRQAEIVAANNYQYYCKNSIKVRVFDSLNKFIEEAHKVGINPNIN